MTFQHVSVLKQEILDYAPSHTEALLDCTLGGGGHSQALLNKFTNSKLLGIDRDPIALETAKSRLNSLSSRIKLHSSRFSQLDSLLESNQQKFDYIIADIGVSSFQLDQAKRGFSFKNDGPLDMRMTQESSEMTAEEWINRKSAHELIQIFYKYGEERFAKKIAFGIVKKREDEPFQTTHQLADFIKGKIPRRFHKKGIHPATQVFQALRIAVNDELSELEALLETSIQYLNPHGRVAIISFHSLEDRIVKHQFRLWENPCQCPPRMPQCICGLTSLGKVIVKRPLKPSQKEIESNPRSRSAKLRVFESI